MLTPIPAPSRLVLVKESLARTYVWGIFLNLLPFSPFLYNKNILFLLIIISSQSEFICYMLSVKNWLSISFFANRMHTYRCSKAFDFWPWLLPSAESNPGKQEPLLHSCLKAMLIDVILQATNKFSNTSEVLSL